MEDVVYEGFGPGLRALFWHKCSGLDAYRTNYCPQYYQTIQLAEECQTWVEYPNPHFSQIDKDLDRTFPMDPFYTSEIKQSIRRVFRSYLWRNPTVGYIQGMNFLVFRLRKYLSEENTFWLFVLIVESYLPLDFYVEMYGATTHATILARILKQYSKMP